MSGGPCPSPSHPRFAVSPLSPPGLLPDVGVDFFRPDWIDMLCRRPGPTTLNMVIDMFMIMTVVIGHLKEFRPVSFI